MNCKELFNNEWSDCLSLEPTGGLHESGTLPRLLSPGTHAPKPVYESIVEAAAVVAE